MVSAIASAMRLGVQPVAVVGPENPNPGNDGAMTWNGGVPSVSSGTTFANSANVLGQPDSKMTAPASSEAARWCTKCNRCPSTSVVN